MRNIKFRIVCKEGNDYEVFPEETVIAIDYLNKRVVVQNYIWFSKREYYRKYIDFQDTIFLQYTRTKR